VRRIENKVLEVAAITAGDIFERFQLDVLDAGARCFYPVTGTGNDHLASSHDACDDGADGIVASVSGAFGLRNSQFHEFFSRFVGEGDHRIRVYPVVTSLSQDKG